MEEFGKHWLMVKPSSFKKELNQALLRIKPWSGLQTGEKINLHTGKSINVKKRVKKTCKIKSYAHLCCVVIFNLFINFQVLP
ncbi:MAG TPA: hypothetical protein ENN24_03715 [Bacteroidetes bacterium]|nr:hypothetical protein [Bacteroidota bacterium]